MSYAWRVQIAPRAGIHLPQAHSIHHPDLPRKRLALRRHYCIVLMLFPCTFIRVDRRRRKKNERDEKKEACEKMTKSIRSGSEQSRGGYRLGILRGNITRLQNRVTVLVSNIPHQSICYFIYLTSLSKVFKQWS